MHLPRSSAVATELIVLDRTGSTNDVLLGGAAELPEFAVVLTTDQTAGRGRMGRQWVAPPGQTLAASVLLRPRLPAGEPLSLERYGWLPLLAGAAMTRAVSALVGDGVGLKWPNDVQIDGRKVSGLLAELLPAGDGVVIGSGVNLEIPADALPTPTSTSLTLHGVRERGADLVDAVLGAYLESLRRLYSELLEVGADASASGLAGEVEELCTTLGREVRVELPGGDRLFGTAVGIDGTGRLQVKRSSDGRLVAVAAGDVTHLRYE
ncbi:BirA family biotin operon repressor/biotin-[acetyl-CoA-carboxylase] ligase [Diaminobutyricimonas aerilata]|uniref:biotin--[biotin carboxyl-carrier protein] ligase n=1 Tax=Diaminobutyricimonas aerilata TaxID=1162967 RepID=A0A2M9CH74_9MICO|nr:biotin--[acetyl-CoA-carboxylase] ligase [Diaminobutyricimonas aerilata]PJJ71205.1 BirA family biotin operon repressor/biotin-[acetyl-CoA-carboxylase] ligase [Diaminobutyricimonas aerilata]